MKNILKNIFVCTILIGVGIGLGANFNKIMKKINDIKDKKVEVVQEEVIESVENTADEEIIEDIVEDEKENIEKEETPKKSNLENQIDKSRNSIIKQCGSEFSDVIYVGDKPPEHIRGNYYIFGINVDGEVAGDMMLYVDKNTFEVYEHSVDGYFGKFRTSQDYEEQYRIEQENKKIYSKDEVARLLVKKQYGDGATPMDDEDTYMFGELYYMMDVTYPTGNDNRRWAQVYVGSESLNVYSYEKVYLDTLK